MEQPNTEAVKEIGRAPDEEPTNVTKAALESDDNVNIHEGAGHKVKTQLRVTSTYASSL
jgi:hypothetical protein